jgi:ubiquinone biosynthesis protein
LEEVTPTLTAAERMQLTRRLMELEMQMFITDGLFHADLHPGNIFFGQGGSIVLLDFGMYGELSDEHRDHFILYWLAAMQHQTRRAFTHLIAQTTRLQGADEAAYYLTFQQLAERFYGSTISEKSITQTYLQIILNGARYGFVFPSDLLLHAKALTTAEALAFTLTPDLRFEREALPIIVRLGTRRMLDPRRLRALAGQVLPELLLFGQLPPAITEDPSGNAEPSQPEWGAALVAATRQLAQTFEPEVDDVRQLVEPAARAVLASVYSEPETDRVLEEIWATYTALAHDLPAQETLGARVMVHLSAATVAAYNVLAAGQSAAQATALIYAIAWRVYTKMGQVPWALAGLLGLPAHDRLRFATTVFRRFPFSAPSYRWQEIKAGPDTVAFNCLRCPVAEYFRSQGLSDLCVNTWCSLDYPLATQWGAQLERSGTIASGAPLCDFRWHRSAQALSADA